MAETEYGKPLAPASIHIRSDEQALPMQLKLPKQRRSYIKCCGCVTAIFLILAVVVLVLIFTVFDIRNPVVRMNMLTVQRLDAVINETLRSNVNVTFLANVTVKNPNAASFKFSNGTTTIYYRGEEVGEAKIPPGKVKARRTMSMNVTVEINPEKVVAVPWFLSDANSGSLTMNSLTVIDGKVKVMNIVKKHVVVRLNCTITYSIRSMAVQQQKCRHRVSI